MADPIPSSLIKTLANTQRNLPNNGGSYNLSGVSDYLAGAKNIDPTMAAIQQKIIPTQPSEAGLAGSATPSPFGANTPPT